MTNGTPLIRRRTTCRLCQSPDVQLVLQLAPSPPVDAFVRAEKLGEAQPQFPLDLFLCRACGHAQLLDVVSPSLLFGDYIYETSSSPGLVEHFRQYADQVFAYAGSPAGRLAVDVGSNDGTLLGFLKQHGMLVVGIDPAQEVARRATERGIETIPAFLTVDVAERVVRERGPAAIVTANNVFAHADDMCGMADGIRTLLAPDGLFVFEVSYLLDMIEGMVFDFIYHEHLCHHSVRPLVSFLRQQGMDLIDVHRIATKGGSLRCFAQRLGGPRAVARSVNELVHHEETIGLNRLEIFAAFAARVQAATDAVGAMADRIRQRGETAAAYGASATGTVLIHQFGLGDVLKFIVDDTPERQHRFSPGHHIPVLPATAIYETRPSHIFVLAWRFADMIMAKHQRYLDGGGQFIIPLPSIRTVSRQAVSDVL